MHPKVCGKLLTHHRRGNGVDVDALRDRIPLRQITEKAPRLDLAGTEASGGGKVFSWLFLVSRNIWEFIGRRIGLGGLPWGHKPGGAPPPLGRALVACVAMAGLLPSSPSLAGFFWSKKNHSEDFIPFGLRLIFLICNTQKQGKTETGTRL